jgi:hypothetical protein
MGVPVTCDGDGEEVIDGVAMARALAGCYPRRCCSRSLAVTRAISKRNEETLSSTCPRSALVFRFPVLSFRPSALYFQPTSHCVPSPPSLGSPEPTSSPLCCLRLPLPLPASLRNLDNFSLIVRHTPYPPWPFSLSKFHLSHLITLLPVAERFVLSSCRFVDIYMCAQLIPRPIFKLIFFLLILSHRLSSEHSRP